MMRLHKDEHAFIELTDAVNQEKELPIAIVEKDYYVSLLLDNIQKSYPNIIFKGGTSLSKCYKVIKRFSEDIDINISKKGPTQGERKKLKNSILAAIDNSEMEIKNKNEIRSGRMFNKYEIGYHSIAKPIGSLKGTLLVESYVFSSSFPYEKLPVSNYILDYLRENDEQAIIESYGLDEFEINVQKIDRTFIDKIFAICDYYENNMSNRNSRHLYDLHKIWEIRAFNKYDFQELFVKVAIERSTNHVNISAQNGYTIIRTLHNIIEDGFLKHDYTEITENLLFDGTNYETVIGSLTDILNSTLIPEVVNLYFVTK